MAEPPADSLVERGKLRVFGRQFGQSVREQAGPIALVLVFAAAGTVVGRRLGVSVLDAVWLYVPTYLNVVPLAIGLLLIGHGVRIAVVRRPARPITALIRDIRERFATGERIAAALPVLAFMPLFAGTFTLFKSVIARINPFSWDAAFAEWDAALHGGQAPWELLQPLLGYPLVTWLVNWGYNAWFLALSIVWVWQAFSLRDRRLRLQFFYTLLLAWILLGCLAAIYFSSAGPCYYGFVVDGPDPFAPLMSYLNSVDARYEVWALSTQDLLWQLHSRQEIQLGSGISAMPSMHVAMAFLYFLVGRRIAPIVGWAFFGFFLLILIGSVHLGWHYAIDGYASVLAVLPIWWLAGRLAARASVPAGAEETRPSRKS